MKKTTVIFIVILIVILVIVLKNSLTVNIGPKDIGTPAGTNGSFQNTNSNNGLETKESNDGPVSVTVTPLDVGDNASLWSFDIALNTHSEEIGEDLTVVSVLIDDGGKTYRPISWEGSAPGGHHRSGVLKFSAISPRPNTLELKINNVGGISERSFKWEL
ncbi:MAG: hypothetical protein ACD_24C00479G0003 [uncultured bacterium]|uniref:DUF4352 domain-containing protein n=1 Tax=candidate division WWE3 bacterium TaxID=2053526 RepID=A0A656PMT3_UNCKA|nr:hypothetical protein P147_WWE3C00001G0192 [candidate division WWE3 bacterium RAAC2_WWE3_1]EKD95470.1 MAG: hypothetical protein ACD_24C00479G0003 [uncultured bacterium]KKS29869.1 MAG: hypothetical protein UU91_C0003G0027 [candidate division WWE3 bacterium GW2011_GWB1_42_117]KKS55294.1 MAG: hypothetical protein UV21_C0002G0168 [candidate division WWE3 bacterium GW2011_GWD2_42_34]KKT05847.1 MAG: hypothetical protein UV83_C0001G0165 [candidate division WWE3 bacterium GW2011_GWE2_43_18]KKT07263.